MSIWQHCWRCCLQEVSSGTVRQSSVVCPPDRFSLADGSCPGSTLQGRVMPKHQTRAFPPHTHLWKRCIPPIDTKTNVRQVNPAGISLAAGYDCSTEGRFRVGCAYGRSKDTQTEHLVGTSPPPLPSAVPSEQSQHGLGGSLTRDTSIRHMIPAARFGFDSSNMEQRCWDVA